jgi:acetolactate synthase I/II/III large subunit
MGERSGGRALLDQLIAQGVRTAFCVPGESYLDVLDALYDAPIRLLSCRHESGAGFMAEAVGKLGAGPGIAFVTRGPGATNASIAVHVARQDSTPMILFVGQVPRTFRDREAFQEVDLRATFAPLAKWAAEIGSADRIPEYVARAFTVATSGRPGPVVLGLPEDVLSEMTSAPSLPALTSIGCEPGAEAMAAVADVLLGAERPLFILGGSTWDEKSYEAMARFAAAQRVPACVSFRRQDLFPNDHPSYAGDLSLGADAELLARLREADVVIAVGARLGEATTGGYERLAAPRPATRLVHVYPDAEELGRVYQPDVAVLAGSAQFARALERLHIEPRPGWREWTERCRAGYEASSRIAREISSGVDPAKIVFAMREALPPDGIVTNGAGNFTTWLHRYFQYVRPRTQLAPTAGAMGYGVPAAIGAKAAFPERTIVAMTGDGDFLMTGQELATAVQYELPIVVVLLNNGQYGTIRAHQERAYPGRPIGTELRNPDFVKLADAYGCAAARITRTEDFTPVFRDALTARVPTLIELVVDRELANPRQSFSDIRAASKGAR